MIKHNKSTSHSGIMCRFSVKISIIDKQYKAIERLIELQRKATLKNCLDKIESVGFSRYLKRKLQRKSRLLIMARIINSKMDRLKLMALYRIKKCDLQVTQTTQRSFDLSHFLSPLSVSRDKTRSPYTRKSFMTSRKRNHSTMTQDDMFFCFVMLSLVKFMG